VHSWPYGAQSPLACEGLKAHTVHQDQHWGLTMLQYAACIVRKIVLSGQCELLSQNPDFRHFKGRFPITSREDSEGKWNVGHPFLLWYSAQLGWQSWQLYYQKYHINTSLLIHLSVDWNGGIPYYWKFCVTVGYLVIWLIWRSFSCVFTSFIIQIAVIGLILCICMPLFLTLTNFT